MGNRTDTDRTSGGYVNYIADSRVRYDRNLVNSLSLIPEYVEGVDTELFTVLMLEFSYQIQHATAKDTLFDGTGVYLVADDLIRKYHMDKHKVKDKVEHPYQFRHLDKALLEHLVRTDTIEERRRARTEEEVTSRLFDTKLENLLYMLSTKVFRYRDLSGAFEGDDTIKAAGGIRILSEVRVFRSRTGKITYYCVLDSSMIKNLSRYYCQVDINSYIGVKKMNLDRLYLYLANLKGSLAAQGKTVSDPEKSPSFDTLCELANVPRFTRGAELKEYEPRYRKRNLNDKMASIANVTNLGVTLRWGKAEGAANAYVPVFCFEEAAADPELSRRMEYVDIFRSVLMRNLLQIYRKVNGMDVMDENRHDKFLGWLYSPLNIKEKELAFDNAYLEQNRELSSSSESRKRAFICKLMEKKELSQKDFLEILRIKL